ncbi:TPA: hypothetical protein TZW92_001855 [Streptococcus suis]|nr:hypothetical protein [Streptococcus suis]
MTRVSKQNAIKYLERKAYPGWDACSDSLAISLADAKHLIDLIYSQSEEEVLNETIYKKDKVRTLKTEAQKADDERRM